MAGRKPGRPRTKPRNEEKEKAKEERRKSRLAMFEGKTIREVFADVYTKLGGTDGMYRWAARNDFNRATFYKLFGRQLPQQTDSNIDMNASITFVDDISPKETKSE